MKPARVSKGIFFYTPSTYLENGLITYRALSEKELRVVEQLIVEDRKPSEAAIRIIEFAILKIEASNGTEVSIEDISFDVITEISTEIVKMSSPSDDDMDSLNLSIDIKLGDALSSETWECSVCRDKRLDKTRNCKFLSEEDQKKYYDKDFKIRVNGSLYTHCPIYDIDLELLSSAIECHNILDLGFLPDEGGFLDQTRFFIIASQKIKYVLKQRELEDLKRRSKERK
jgi:hypothetical protein